MQDYLVVKGPIDPMEFESPDREYEVAKRKKLDWLAQETIQP